MTTNLNNSMVNLQRSVKDFCITNLITTASLNVYFDIKYVDTKLVDAAKIKQWIVVDINNINSWGVLKTAAVSFYLHSRNDPEGDDLAGLRDSLFVYLEDMSKTDGQVRIPLYNTSTNKPWAKLGDMLVYVMSESPVYIADDKTKFREISVLLRWAI